MRLMRQIGTRLSTALNGKASRAYDNGSVPIGDDIPHLANAEYFFLYFKAMPNGTSMLRYTDHKGE